MGLSRRTFLLTLGTVAAGATLPAPMTSRITASALEHLHGRAQSLAQRTHGTPPLTILREARSQLLDVETLLLGAAGWQRTRLYRTGALLALVAAQASRLAGTRYTASLLGRSADHARNANDGPLLAQSLLLRARHVGEAAHAADAGTQECAQLLTAALYEAGYRREQRLLRALVRYELAWEHAALGDSRAARSELQAADIEHDVAQPAPDVIEVDARVMAGRLFGHGVRGSVLRRLNLPDDAISASTLALTGPPLWSTVRLIDIAAAHTAKGDVDAAAARLEEAYRLSMQARLEHRQGRVRALRAQLPDSGAVRRLDAVMHG